MLTEENTRLREAITAMRREAEISVVSSKRKQELQTKDAELIDRLKNEIDVLRKRLKKAVTVISRLNFEKQALNEISNRLRSRLLHLDGSEIQATCSRQNTSQCSEGLTGNKSFPQKRPHTGRHERIGSGTTENEKVNKVEAPESVRAAFNLLEDSASLGDLL
ncbi:unnamed protein product [Protopolystoma xenopodis]|uniref:Uncharacterized protein n=1 Tax=Protopolystoma xenopodis TaxID=117903 RepID=A0A448WA93_9PLAT|nr:unnamed protein product [Protopolystoma xenopodis]